MAGKAKGGVDLSFGDFGIQALEAGWITARQIEAARIAMTRHVKRGAARSGFASSRTSPSPRSLPKPAWVRAKATPNSGSPWSSPDASCLSSGGVDETPGARRHGTGHPESCRSRRSFVIRPGTHGTPEGSCLMVKTKEHVAEMRLLGDAELLERLSETRRELFNLRFQTGDRSAR